MPIAAITAAAAPLIVSVAFGRGAFNTMDLQRTAIAVAGFAPLIVVLMTSPVLTSALNARRRGVILLVGGSLNVLLNVILDVMLGLSIGIAGVAAASSISSTLVLVYFAIQLSRSDTTLRLRPLVRVILLSAIASLPASAVLGVLCWSGSFPAGTVEGFLTLAALAAIALISYSVIATRLGISEPRQWSSEVLGRLVTVRDRRRTGHG